MSKFSCVVIGNESLLIGCADMILERGHGISAVVSRDPEIRAWAERKGLPLEARVADLAGRFQPGGFDWLLSIANLALIPESVLALPARGAVNFHDGPLPAYAGLNAPAWAVINREAEYGVTWHLIEGGIDEGGILAQKRFPVAEDDTAFLLNSKCYAAALESFAEMLPGLESGAPERREQDLSGRSYCARDDRPAAACRLDFARPAAELVALVRGLDFGAYWNPLGHAKIAVPGGQTLVVRAAEIDPGARPAAPGTVLAAAEDVLIVATAEGAIRLSGFSDIHGRPVQADALAPKDGTLPALQADEAQALTDAIAGTAAGEGYWRRRLQGFRPAELAVACRPEGPADWATLPASLPAGLEGARRVATLKAWALLCDGHDHASLAWSDAHISRAAAAAPGVLNPWVPLDVGAAEAPAPAFAATVEDTAAQLDSIARHTGFATDLLIRDPAIPAGAMPAVGLAEAGSAPIEGTALTVELPESGTDLTLHYDRNRLAPADVEMLVARLATLAEAVVSGAADDTALDRLPILPEAERRRLLTEWNATEAPYDAALTIHAAIEAQARRTPNAPALAFEGETLTYAEVNARANRLAHVLRSMGVGPGAHVGLCVSRSPALVIGALGILKAGGAYVPLDPAYPADRLQHYVSDSAAKVIVTETALAATLPASSAAVLTMDDDARLAAASAGNPEGGAAASDLAYLIYTSGSTGTPKGVMVEHAQVANFFAGMDARIGGPREGGVWLAVTSLAFDISVLELFYTLARGMKLVLCSDESRLVMSKGPMQLSESRIEFGLFYWGNDDGAGPRKYHLLLEGAKFADAHGFNSIWTPERHFHAFGGPYPNPSVTGAAVAAVTKNLSVRAGSVVAPLHHPIRIAEEWSVIDNLTNGRAGLAIASGWQPDDFVLRPENTPPANKPAMYEAIETLRKLWRGETVDFARKDGSIFAALSQPRPVSPELPIWVTTAGNPDTWREAGEIGANVLTHLLGQTIEEVAGKIEIYHEALRKAGRDPRDHTVTMMLHTLVGEDRDSVRERARGPMKDYLRSAAGLIKQYAWAFPAFKRPKGVTSPFEMDLGTLTEEEMDAILDFAFERYFEDAGLFGTVEDAAARAEQLKRIGVGEIGCLIDYGVPTDEVMEGLRYLAEALKRANAPAALAEDDFSIAAEIVRHGVTHLQCTPSMARMIAGNAETRVALSRVGHLMIGGEALPAELVESLREATAAKILNMYGPTETTIWSTVEDVDGPVWGTVPVGRPIANTRVYVLDGHGAPAPVGVPGELFIGGHGVTRGYWQRAELTAERFVADPFAGGAARMYRTGDLVRWRSDGRLDFLGRTDHQVKIRGQRIELGEIEAAMAAVPGLDQAVVVAREMGPGDTRLVGYYTATGAVEEAALRAHLEAHLPDVMVPAHLVALESFPLTPNKKVDRKALPEPQARAAAPAGGGEARAAAGPAPKGELEKAIADIWARTLGISGIRADDNFFALGGHSLLAVQAHREIREALSVPRLAITDIFRFPTLGGLAAHVTEQLGGPAPEPEAPAVAAPERSETMSRRRAMRAGRSREKA